MTASPSNDVPELARESENAGSVGLSIVIPVYRSAASIRELVDRLAGLTPEGGLEIVLVVDGSPDGSLEVCQTARRELPLPIAVIEHARNFGEHHAVMTGLRHARGRYVVTMDDDLQHAPAAVLTLYDHARLGGWDAVYAQAPERRHAAWRNLASRFAAFAADRLLEKPRGLHLSTFRCLSRFTVRHVATYRGPFPYVDGLVTQVTNRIDGVAVDHLPRWTGRSNYTLRRLVRLWLALAIGFSLMPLRLGLFVAGAIGGVGLVGAATLASRPETGDPAPLLVAASLLAVTQLVCLGLVGEYVGRCFLILGGKPQAIVRSVAPALGAGAQGALE